MKKGLIHRIAKSIYHRYTRGDYGTTSWQKRFAYFGKNSVLTYPAILSGQEKISIGDDTVVFSNSRIENYTSRGGISISIGNRCHIGYYFSILNASSVKIGDDVLIASHVLITSENHGVDPEIDVPYVDQPLISSPVEIGDGCWIGEKVCILPGVSIGKKCIIGAGSVVTKSVPDCSMAVGNPARVIKIYNFKTHSWEKKQ